MIKASKAKVSKQKRDIFFLHVQIASGAQATFHTIDTGGKTVGVCNSTD
jgi:hypothetical protein